MEKMPTIFIGHGAPTNALENNAYTQALNRLGQELPRPKAILSVSAHWVTPGTKVLDSAAPKTIHDFYGFPPEMYQIQYPAPGAPEEARRLAKELDLSTDGTWGLDHGTWTVLRHLYPQADIPVFQLSIDQGKDFQDHLELGCRLTSLRERGVLILGSGNLTHNLRDVDLNISAVPFDWAVEFDAKAQETLEARDWEAFTHPQGTWGEKAFRHAHPTVEHYVPLLYVLGASRTQDVLSYPYVGIQNGSLSMRAVLFQ